MQPMQSSRSLGMSGNSHGSASVNNDPVPSAAGPAMDGAAARAASAHSTKILTSLSPDPGMPAEDETLTSFSDDSLTVSPQKVN